MKTLESYKLGSLQLKNRIVVAPLTRSRAIGNIPNELMAEYYSQRAGPVLLFQREHRLQLMGLGTRAFQGVFHQSSASQSNGKKTDSSKF